MPLQLLNSPVASVPLISTDAWPVDFLTAFLNETDRLTQCGGTYSSYVYNGLVTWQEDTGTFWILINDQLPGLASSWQLYNEWLILGTTSRPLNNSFVGNNTFTGSLTVSGSSVTFISNQYLTGSLFVTGAADIHGPFRVFVGSNNQPALQVSSSGLLILGSYNSLPTAVPGAIAYSSSNFYVGL